ncbi:MAG: hypothetical protein IPL43_12065 [Micropruina sp.]|nr:hypothetical protein [Micropruina sp.]
MSAPEASTRRSDAQTQAERGQADGRSAATTDAHLEEFLRFLDAPLPACANNAWV